MVLSHCRVHLLAHTDAFLMPHAPVYTVPPRMQCISSLPTKLQIKYVCSSFGETVEFFFFPINETKISLNIDQLQTILLKKGFSQCDYKMVNKELMKS